MTQRARIVVGSAATLFVLFALIVGAIAGIARTVFGREQIRKALVSALRGKVHGSVYVGRISGGLFNGVTVDSFAIRDPDDSLFVSTGPVTLRYDLRDLFERRILIRAASIAHPFVHLKQHADSEWNFRRVFSSGKSGVPHVSGTFGDFIVIDSAIVRDGTLVLTLPWHPSPSWHGAARDSVIRAELANREHDIKRTSDGFTRTWRWTKSNGLLVHARLNDPDSVGRVFQVVNLSATEFDPPFRFQNIRGTARQLGDSIWLDVPHFDLPASTGNAKGKIVWGSDLPIRYAIHVVGDSVSMRDVSWVYATLPTTGGGRTELDIHNNPRHLHLMDYALTNMDMRSTRSHLTGRMTFELGADTLVVKDVQLGLAPVNFDLLRTLNGKPFPYDWQGDITGTVRASGGNLGRFDVQDAQLTFTDAHVPGAISKGSAVGQLNIVDPALAEFHELKVNLETLDLRTLQYLNAEFPRLKGTVSGSATLDSSWLDVRFRDAIMFHHDSTHPVSRVTGSGRVTWGEQYLTYDLALQADSISMSTMSRSYALIPLRGMYSGPIRVQGQSPALHVVTTLASAGGTMTYDGQVDMDPLVYGAHGTGTFAHADLRAMMHNPTVPHTNLNSTWVVDLTGDSLATLQGTATARVASSDVNSTHIDSTIATVRFQHGVAYIDTVSIHTPPGTFDARGSVAMVPGRQGMLAYVVALDSLAAINRLLGRSSTLGLTGAGTMRGTVRGSIDSLALDGTGSVRDIALQSARITHATGTVALDNITHAPHGLLTLAADSLTMHSLLLDHVAASLRVNDLHHATFNTEFFGHNHVHAYLQGALAIIDTSTMVTLQAAEVSLDSTNKYTLTSPAHLTATPNVMMLDSLLLERQLGGGVTIRDVRLAGDSIRGSLRTSDLDLSVLELLSSQVSDLHGALAARVDLHGTIHQPRVNGAITVTHGSASFPQAGTQANNINAEIALDNDTIRVNRLTAETAKDLKGNIAVNGTIAFDQYEDPVFDLRAVAHTFRMIDRPTLAALDVSTSEPLTLTGPYSGAVVRGGIRVDRGTIYIPELIRKRVVDLHDPELYDVIDTTEAQNRALLPQTPSEFTKHVRLEDVGVNIGDDVWLRSAEANIKLGGSLNVTSTSGTSTDEERPGELPRLALQGELRATRGTYRLNIVPLVQPTFEVENGTLRFFGTADLDPTLNITAINTVRKPQQSVTHQDIRIRATIGGTLSSPTLTLSSADNLPLTQSDLLSYLVTGEPAFALDYNTRTYVNQLTAVVIRSAGNVISSAIPRSVFDVVELQTPGAQDATDTQDRIDNPTLYNLLNTRAVLGKQLNGNLFLNFSTGFCAENFRNNLGFRLEYRFSRLYRLLFGLEPGSSELSCTRSGAAQSVQQTPPQFGLDLFRAWRF